MKYESPNQKNIIKELNDEVERGPDIITPLLAIPTIFLIVILLIAQIVRHAEAIDKFCQRHWALIGWFLVIVALALIVRWAVKNTWG